MRAKFLRFVGAQTRYNNLVFSQGEFLRHVNYQNESLGIILMYYMFKY